MFLYILEYKENGLKNSVIYISSKLAFADKKKMLSDKSVESVNVRRSLIIDF